MLIWEILRSAYRSLAANRLRTCLTMLGIIIGVASVVAMIGLGEGARINVENSVKSLGTNLLTVRPGMERRRHRRQGTVQTLTLKDAYAIQNVQGVANIAPEVTQSAQVKYLASNTNTRIVGTTQGYRTVRAVDVAAGAFITQSDISARRRIAVLGAEAASTLFGKMDPLGERIQIKGIGFTVTGVLEAKGDAGWFNPDDMIIIPVSTFQQAIYGIENVAFVSVQVEDGYPMEQAQEDIERLIRSRHRITGDKLDDFHVRSQVELLERMNEITGSFAILLVGIAAISLVVGGIGIMNIMLVSVRERTREIGIRKAVGARRQDILLQFLIEAVSVCILGGLVGIAVGYGIAAIIDNYADFKTVIPMYAIFLAVGTSASVGIIFGVWPAIEASRLDPVEALRYE